MSSLRFYLGTHMITWLWKVFDIPLFVSHRRLDGDPKRGPRRSAYPRATTPWALDSGGFTELKMFGEWRTTPEEYVAAVRRYDAELGSMEWAAPQDWMCEPAIIAGGWHDGQLYAGTHLSVAEHQALTLDNYLELTSLAPDLGFIPVLQGWSLADYHRHADAYEAAGVDLASLPLVGVGSVCRRESTDEIAMLFDSLSARGYSLHGFGVKARGLAKAADFMVSSDSLAWSYGSRRAGTSATCMKKSCSNCLHAALEWRRGVLTAVGERQYSLSLYGGAA